MLGLQSPILGETLSFNICRREFVQILNVGRNHWITVSFKGECIEQLDVIDIMYHHVICRLSRNESGIYIWQPSFWNISTGTKEQIASICFCKKKEIHATICDVQKQQGGKDCGLFALAFAVTHCDRQNPSEMNFIQYQLREHLTSCFENNSITPFPTRSRKKCPAPSTKRKIPVYCCCRQPDDESKTVECSSWKEWNHEDCEVVPNDIWTIKSYKNCWNS